MSAQQTVGEWLAEAAAEVHRIEQRAQRALGGQDGQREYEAGMREKALLLAGLAEDGQRFAQDHPDLMDRVERFSRSAQTSLEVGSVFFMSALLYPEDHRPGEPNDLDLLAAEADRSED